MEGLILVERTRERRGGQPPGTGSIYTDELAERILSRMADGETVTSICADPDYPTFRTINRWAENVAESSEFFVSGYARAKRYQARFFAEQTLDIADSATPETARTCDLKIRARQWWARARLPAEFGDQGILAGLQPQPGGSAKLTIEFVRPPDAIEAPAPTLVLTVQADTLDSPE